MSGNTWLTFGWLTFGWLLRCRVSGIGPAVFIRPNILSTVLRWRFGSLVWPVVRRGALSGRSRRIDGRPTNGAGKKGG